MSTMMRTRTRRPYRRPRNRRFRRTNRYRRIPTNKSLNKKIKKIENQVELKWYETILSGTIDENTVTPLILNAPVQGVSQTTRIGYKHTATSLKWIGYISPDLGSVTGNTIVRMIIFWDRQSNGVAPNITGNILTGTTALLQQVQTPSFIPAVAWQAHYQIENHKRFKILYDEVMDLAPQYSYVNTVSNAVQVGVNTCVLRGKVKLGRDVMQDGTLGDTSSMVTNALYCVLMASNVTLQPSAYINFRYYYKDP